MSESLSPVRRALDETRAALRHRHQAGADAAEVAAAWTHAVDGAVRSAWEQHGGPATGVALGAVGGYGRRELAPYSDVDLLFVLPGKAGDDVVAIVKKTVRALWDAGLDLAQNVASAKELLEQARTDPTLATSLLSLRPLAGDPGPLRTQNLERLSKDKGEGFRVALEKLRAEEQSRYGDTAHLLEPNLKRSAGGLRDIQAIGWLGLARLGAESLTHVEHAGLLGIGDAAALEEASTFLRRLRHELHFRAGKANDLLARDDQVAIAGAWGYVNRPGMLGVEQFMRDVLRRTTAVAEAAERFWEGLAPPPKPRFFGRNKAAAGAGWKLVHNRLTLEPAARAAAVGDLARLAELAGEAAERDASLDRATVEALRQRWRGEPPGTLAPAAAKAFLDMLARGGGGLHRVLRQFHAAGALPQFVPHFERVRGLIQFNAYHRYTVDEHTLLLVQHLEGFGAEGRKDPPALAFRAAARRDLLLLAALLHDLGKGFEEDHCEVGAGYAHDLADRFALDDHDRGLLTFLVQQHLMLSRMAFERDTTQPAALARFAQAVGSEERLHPLYALTVADVMATSPDALNDWRGGLLADVYLRSLACFGEDPDHRGDPKCPPEVLAVAKAADDKAWIKSLPPEDRRTADRAEELLDARRRLPEERAVALARHLPERDAVMLTVLTHEHVAPGIFHKLCGALAAHHLEVQSARIHTLADGSVLDVFVARDVHCTGPTPKERRDRIAETVRRVLAGEISVDDALWSGRSSLFVSAKRIIPEERLRVMVDNASDPQRTIIDVFASDRRGLLFTMARTLHQLGLSVEFAKIATYSDEVVDVFYVREADGRKAAGEAREAAIRTALADAVRRLAENPRSMGF